MKRIDRVLAFVRETFEQDGTGVTATQVAEAISCWPNDASADLNRLFERGYVQKTGKKPVIYTPASNASRSEEDELESDDPFRAVVGANGSMKAQVQLAKAAITYPPHGLHTLISGNSGVGKTLFAETIWKYAKSVGAFGGRDVPFVTFNCAEYADNPQLLLATLFGHARGAFTGAVGEKEGLVETATGGVLFLDEVHRLPPAGQEMLFVLIDKKQFRRLGETRDRTSELMIICATTEDPNGALLTTFKRRIPVHIKLPDLNERPLRERVEMVEYCFARESARLQTPIFIAGKALKRFVNGRYRANVGDLKNAVQLACANALLRERLDSHRPIDLLRIDSYDILQPFVGDSSDVTMANPLLKSEIFQQGLMIQPGQSGGMLLIEEDGEQSIWDFLSMRARQYRELALVAEDVAYLLAQDIEGYCENDIAVLFSNAWQEQDALEGRLSSEIAQAAGWLIARAGRYFDKKFYTAVSTALAWHLQHIQKRSTKPSVLKQDEAARLEAILQERYPEEVSFLMELQPQFEQRLGTMLHEQDMAVLATYLGIAKKMAISTYAVLVVGYGVGSASGTVRFVNNLLSTHHIYAIDMTSTMTEADVLEAIGVLIGKISPVKGVLVLSDMGAVPSDEQGLRAAVGTECIVLPCVSTELVIEAGRLTLDPEDDLSQIARRVVQRFYSYVRSALEQYDIDRAEEVPNYAAMPGKDVILLLCATDEGMAERAREILESKVQRSGSFAVVTASAVDGFKSALAEYGNRVKLIISNLPVERADTIPVLPLDRLFMAENLHLIDTLLWQIQQFDKAQDWDVGLGITTRSHARQLIERQILNLAPHLAGDSAVREVERLVESFDQEYFGCSMPIDLYTSLFIHCLCMFDRAVEGEEIPMPSISEDELSRCARHVPKILHLLDDAARRIGTPEISEAEAYCLLLSFRQAMDVAS